MPKEINDPTLLDEIAPKASEIRVKRVKDVVKLKFRTKRYLYTIKLTEKEAETLIGELEKMGKKIVYLD